MRVSRFTKIGVPTGIVAAVVMALVIAPAANADEAAPTVPPPAATATANPSTDTAVATPPATDTPAPVASTAPAVEAPAADVPAPAATPETSDPAPAVSPTPEVAPETTTNSDPPTPATQPAVHSLAVQSNTVNHTTQNAQKVFVCKYVGTPGVDERLQTGQNPISVSVHAIQHNEWDGTVPGYFSDAHDRSYVLAYDTGQAEPDVSACPTPVGPPPACVVTASFTHTYDADTNSGVVTAKGEFCGKTFYVTPTEWSYTGNAVWGQDLVDTNQVTISSPGTYSFGNPVTCGQGDIYAAWDAPIVPTSHLSGPSVEFQEHFLSDYSDGPTTYTNQGTSCWSPPPPVDVCKNIDGNQATVPDGYVQDGTDCVLVPPVVAPSATLNHQCTDAGPQVVYTALAGSNDTAIQVYLNGVQTEEHVVTANSVYTSQITLTEDSYGGSVTVEIKVGSVSLTGVVTVTTDCATPVVVHPANYWPHDSCGVSDDSVNVPGTLIEASVNTVTDPQTGSVITYSQYASENGNYNVNEWTTTNGVHIAHVTFVPLNSAVVIAAPGPDDTYTVEGPEGRTYAVWADYTFSNEPCPTNPPSTNPPSTTPPAANITPGGGNNPPSAMTHETSEVLASTGSDVTGMGIGAASLLMFGLVLLIIRRVRRRTIAE